MLEKQVFPVLHQLSQIDYSLLNRFVHKSQINCINYQKTLGQNFLVELSCIPEKMQSFDNF